MRLFSWWKGARGEWFVVAQVFLFMIVGFGPRNPAGWTVWKAPWDWMGSWLGGLLLGGGVVLMTAGMFRLGPGLTPLPYPKEGGSLIEIGPYQWVRHPIYSGILLASFGWAFWVHGGLTLGYALLLFVFFDIKSRREERWLKEKFTNYADYQRRVRKLIPFLY